MPILGLTPEKPIEATADFNSFNFNLKADSCSRGLAPWTGDYEAPYAIPVSLLIPKYDH
jgi:hypothetical protein